MVKRGTFDRGTSETISMFLNTGVKTTASLANIFQVTVTAVYGIHIDKGDIDT